MNVNSNSVIKHLVFKTSKSPLSLKHAISLRIIFSLFVVVGGGIVGANDNKESDISQDELMLFQDIPVVISGARHEQPVNLSSLW